MIYLFISMKNIITEEEKRRIKNLYNIQEDLGQALMDKLKGDVTSELKGKLEKIVGGKEFTAKDFEDFFKGKNKPEEIEKISKEITNPEDYKIENINVDSNWMTITKKVIDKLEGGYWNPKCKHPSSGMGKSTETMFGLDRYNGNIESTPEGRQFFAIIDREKENLGMSNFCKKWKWLYRGGDKEEILKNLAAKIMKNSFDRNMRNYVKDSETKKRILGNKGLLLHMSYASWNGPGFFQKFAKSLEKGVKDGMSNNELINLAIEDRSKTKLLNKGKVESLIKNPSV
jgi:hypothetical protein